MSPGTVQATLPEVVAVIEALGRVMRRTVTVLPDGAYKLHSPKYRMDYWGPARDFGITVSNDPYHVLCGPNSAEYKGAVVRHYLSRLVGSRTWARVDVLVSPEDDSWTIRAPS